MSNEHMPCSGNVRPIHRSLWIAGAVLCCAMPAYGGQTASAANAGNGTAVAEAPRDAAAKPTKRQVRQAESAYAAGAKKLDADDLTGAEQEFQQALKLNPTNRNYAIALSVAREHRVTELVHQSTRARLAGETAKADTLLAQARQIDPQNPIVLEHAQVSAATGSVEGTGGRSMFAPVAQPWRIEVPNLAGPIELQPSTEVKSFDLRGQSHELLQNVATQFGIHAVIDPSVQQRTLHFALDNVGYERAMYVLTTLTDTFAVPVDEKTILVAKDDPQHRADLERQAQETIDVPGVAQQKLQDMTNVIHNIFNLKDAVVDASAGRIVVRGPVAVFDALNRTLEPLMEDPAEVMLEIRMYEINSSRTTKIGVKLPTEFVAINIDAAAKQIVNDNQAIVEQAIAQGLVPPTATDLQIALALLSEGLVQSSIANNLLGVFGGGTTMTGITSPDFSVTLNLGLNASDTRTLDDVQLRVSDQQEGTFRAGTRYPIMTSTYTTGISTSPSATGNATINGVNVSSLLNQFSGGSSVTIPQVTYEDLGLTLKAKPTMQAGGHISMQLDVTIQAISGSGLNNIPVLLNRHFTSSLTVADGESAMLISDVSKTETTAMLGIPGLSELPGFRMPTQVDTVKNDGQLVVLVTPHVVRNRSEGAAGPRIALRLAPTQ